MIMLTAGVDYISLGCLTHTLKNFDLSLKAIKKIDNMKHIKLFKNFGYNYFLLNII